MEKKEVKVLQFEGSERAQQIVTESIELYQKTFVHKQ
jgi:inorganic pyrophosphatase